MGTRSSKPKKPPPQAPPPEERQQSPKLRNPRPVEEISITGFSGDVSAKYRVDAKVLGEGHYGTVRKCQDKETGEWYALKTIKKAKVKRADYLRREIDLLLTVNHPNIINVVDVFEDKFNLQIVTELCTGGELFDAIIAKSKSAEGHYSEVDAATLIRKVLSAIDHCHSEHDIVHRDLKPENFLFKGPGPGEGEPVIIDFGLSKMVDLPDEHMATRVGTPYYIAPEVLNRNYTKACDLWSIGVITYILLCGYPPFYGDNDAAIFKQIMSGVFEFPDQEWKGVSLEAKAFIKRLLNLNAAARPSAAEAESDPWFALVHAEAVPIMAELGPRLESFVAMHKLKKHALHVIAEHLTQKEIGEMREVFTKLDVSGTGTLTVEELKGALVDFPDIAAEIESLVDGIDLDGNNSIDYNEFIAATLSRNLYIREENIKFAFDYFDNDGTGNITVDNLAKIFGSSQHAIEVLGEEGVDLNGDSKISFEEFKTMMMSHDGDRQKLLHHSKRDPSFGASRAASRAPSMAHKAAADE